MEYLDQTYPDPADNLRCDVHLLELCESGESGEVLRVWEQAGFAVVVGRSNRTLEDVRVSACRSRDIPVLRRPSGGGAVLVGPGSLNYALVLRIACEPSLETIRGTNAFVMERHRRMLERVTGLPVSVDGFTDLAVGGRKVSGNAQYRKRHALLFHGTFLVGLDPARVEEVLEVPAVAPGYRGGRSHADFLMNLDVSASSIREALRSEWRARSEFAPVKRRTPVIESAGPSGPI